MESESADRFPATTWNKPGLLLLGWWLLSVTSPAQVIVSLDVTTPIAGALVGDNLAVVMNAASTYQIQSVTATVANRTTNLLNSLNVGWTGNLSLAGLSRGTQTLLVTAIDVYGNSGQSQISFVHDVPPVLTLLNPSPSFSVFTRPQLEVRAVATDDDPVGVVIQVYCGGVLLAKATNNLDAVVDLSNWDGQSADLQFLAKDSAGQITTYSAGAYVFANTNVIELDRVDGDILDVSASNILFTEGPNVLKAKSRSTGVETALVNSTAYTIYQAALTPHGAIFISGNLYEVRDGTLIGLGGYQENLVVKGNYAIWIKDGATLILRDLLAGTNVVVSSTAGNIYDDVAPNGDVVYWGNDYQIYLYRSGITTRIDSGIYPRTDGVNIGYFTGTNFADFALFDGTNQIKLGPRAGENSLMLSGGWAAWHEPGTPAFQVWTRSPAGVLSQKTFFGTSSILLGLTPNGDLMVQRWPDLYFISAGSALHLGPWNGEPAPFWQEGNWYASLGGSLLTFLVPSTIMISQPGWTTNGDFSFHSSASIGQQVVLQESTNLIQWVSVRTNYMSGTAGMQVTVPVSSVSDKKFYRLSSVE